MATIKLFPSITSNKKQDKPTDIVESANKFKNISDELAQEGQQKQVSLPDVSQIINEKEEDLLDSVNKDPFKDTSSIMSDYDLLISSGKELNLLQQEDKDILVNNFSKKLKSNKINSLIEQDLDAAANF